MQGLPRVSKPKFKIRGDHCPKVRRFTTNGSHPDASLSLHQGTQLSKEALDSTDIGFRAVIEIFLSVQFPILRGSTEIVRTLPQRQVLHR
jgi:hypothetical protein